MIIGINGLLTRNNLSPNNKDLIELLNPNLSKLYQNEVSILQNNTYLIDNNCNYYQRIFTDFYGSLYLYKVYKINKEGIIFIINTIFDDYKNYTEVFENLVLIFDGYYDKDKEVLFDLLQYQIERAQNERKLKNICQIYKIMLKSLFKYSSDKILKDKSPIHCNATYHADEIIEKLYTQVFFTFSNYLEPEISYDDIFTLVSCINRWDLAIKAIMDLKNVYNAFKFKILSIIRDSFEFLNRSNFNSELMDIYEGKFTSVCQQEIYKMATNSKAINKMSLRELLNAFTYNYDHMKISETDINRKINLKRNLFPSIFNLNNYLKANFSYSQYPLEIVKSTDELFYNGEQEYSSIKIINVEEYQNCNYILNEEIITICLYSHEINSIPAFLSSLENLKSIDISPNIQILEKNCFERATNLLNIILPRSLKKMDDFAIYECHRLKNLSIPDSVTYLGESFVEDCFCLKKIGLPSKLKYLGQYAFEECASLSVVNFSDNLVNLLDGTFKSCDISDFQSLNLPLQLSSIPKICFLDCKSLKELDLSKFEKLQTINNYAFYGCLSLETIIFPSNVQDIKMLAFGNCPLKKVIFKGIPKQLSKYSFYNENTEITFIFEQLQKSFTITNQRAFLKMLNSLKIPSDESKYENDIAYIYDEEKKGYILDYSFNQDIKEFNDKKVPIVGATIGVFGNHELLDDVYLGKSFKTAADWMFEDCYSLYQVNLEDSGIEKINAHMFELCHSLKQIKLPSTIKVIEKHAFESCRNLDSIVFPNTDYNEKILHIPNNVCEIQNHAFHNCEKIQKIIIENSNIIIGKFAFSGLKNLKIIEFSNGIGDINKISDGAFSCKNRRNVSINISIDTENKKRIGL